MFHSIVIQILIGNTPSKPRIFLHAFFGPAGIRPFLRGNHDHCFGVVFEGTLVISSAMICNCQYTDKFDNPRIITSQHTLTNGQCAFEAMDGFDEITATVLQCTNTKIGICNVQTFIFAGPRSSSLDQKRLF